MRLDRVGDCEVDGGRVGDSETGDGKVDNSEVGNGRVGSGRVGDGERDKIGAPEENSPSGLMWIPASANSLTISS